MYVFYCKITNFLRYKQENAQRAEAFRSYSANVPGFMCNRPLPFLKHVTTRLRAEVKDHDIRQISKSEFEVCSAESTGIKYNCFLGSATENPKCSCFDFKKFKWPCKHMLKIITSIDGYSWKSLPASYRSNPLFLLDKCIVGDKYIEEIDDSTIEIAENSKIVTEKVEAQIEPGQSQRATTLKQKKKSNFEKKRQLALTFVNSISNELHNLKETTQTECILDEAIPSLEKLLESIRSTSLPQPKVKKCLDVNQNSLTSTSAKIIYPVKKPKNRFQGKYIIYT